MNNLRRRLLRLRERQGVGQKDIASLMAFVVAGENGEPRRDDQGRMIDSQTFEPIPVELEAGFTLTIKTVYPDDVRNLDDAARWFTSQDNVTIFNPAREEKGSAKDKSAILTPEEK